MSNTTILMSEMEIPPPEERHSLFEAAVQEAHRHKWLESEKAGRDIGYDAIRQWHHIFWRSFCRECWMEHVQGERYWSELDNHDFGLLKCKFHDNVTLVDQVVERFKEGGENLDVIQWATEQGIDMQEVIDILAVLDINSRRLAPAVEIDSEDFVKDVKAHHHTRALVVDDDTDTREMLGHILMAEGIEVILCSTGEEAMDQVQKRRFDLFLIDIMLPGKHGAEVAWYLLRHGVTGPIIAISAVLDSWSEDDLYDCGFSHLMSKPFDMEKIRQVARETIQSLTDD